MKESILEKAAEMFLTFGFKSVTMDEIAAELGISKKTIYLHFPNKTALVEASTYSLLSTISSGIDKICESGKNAIDELFSIRNFMMTHLKNEMSSPFHQLQKFYPKIATTLRAKQFEKMEACVKANLEKGINHHLYRDDIDKDFIARIYFIGTTGLRDNEVFPGEKFNTSHLTKQYLNYHLRAIVTKMGMNLLMQAEKKFN